MQSDVEGHQKPTAYTADEISLELPERCLTSAWCRIVIVVTNDIVAGNLPSPTSKSAGQVTSEKESEV